MACPPSLSRKNTVSIRRRGFTLVEVTLALGLISFCVVALFGLLPIGLDSLRTAGNEAAATNCLEPIAASIRNASLQAGSTTKFVAAAPYQTTLSWDLGGSVVKATLPNLTGGAFPDTVNSAEQQFTAYIKITPPADPSKTGTALVSVAWPAQATWDEPTSKWKNAQGSVLTQLVFLPN